MQFIPYFEDSRERVRGTISEKMTGNALAFCHSPWQHAGCHGTNHGRKRTEAYLTETPGLCDAVLYIETLFDFGGWFGVLPVECRERVKTSKAA